MKAWWMGWQARAECRDEDQALFFAPNYFERRSAKNAREAKAKVLCRRCPVIEECREYALRTREEHGVWGGLNEAERRRVLRLRDHEVALAQEAGHAVAG